MNRMLHRSLPALAGAIVAGTAAAQWHQVTTASSPSARAEAAATYDPIGGSVLLFGGAPTLGSPFADTWTYNGSNWTQLSPATSPTGRAQAGLVYDLHRGVAVLYGGGNTSAFGGPSIDQTWEFDGTTWQRIFPTTTPGGLALFGMAYDVARQRAVLYGGDADSFFPIASAGTWEYDGLDWHQVTTANSPGPLERPAMCYDQSINRIVLFGGIDPQTGGTNNTWTYDGANWSIVPVTSARPSVRTAPRMVYDSVRAVCILHGGLDANTGNVLTDTWEFDGSGWKQIVTPGPSPSRWGMAMTMDPVRREVVAYGGANAAGSVVAGTFEYGAYYQLFGTGCAGSNGTPSLGAVNAPHVGSTFSLQLGNLALSSSVAFVITGLSNTTSNLGPLPLNLTPLGLTGCTSYASADVSTLVAAVAGNASWSLPIPSAISLIGLAFYNQAASIDPGINPAGLTVSNAGAGVVGN